MEFSIRSLCAVIVCLSMNISILNAGLGEVKKRVTALQKVYAKRDVLFRNIPNRSTYMDDVAVIEKFLADEGLVGTSDSTTRRRNARRVAQLWTAFIQKRDAGFAKLQKSLHEGFKKAGYVPVERLEGVKAGDISRLRHSFSSLISAKEELKQIADDSSMAQFVCKGRGCKDKFGQLTTFATTLYDAIEEIEKNLDQLKESA